MRDFQVKKIAIIGQGYVGLPLAIAFSDYFPVIGFDINETRIDELRRGVDRTLEADKKELERARELFITSNQSKGYDASNSTADIADANVYIVTVPTPIDRYNSPDLSPLLEASKMIGGLLNPGDLVIYESTVYPGCTEEECIPVLESCSGLKFNQDFFVGYSPERINPGDKVNSLQKVMKVTSGSTPEAGLVVDGLYKNIIEAGTHLAPSIKVAEAAKVIENAQRDVNISFMNELALIFDRVGIDTQDVLDAAGTKYNFLRFKPGLVGGHCISVDPYYLAQKATQLGYHPHVILSGREVNDQIASFIASKVVKLMIQKNIKFEGAKALVLGITFKENCPDMRNSKVIDMIQDLQEFGLKVDIYDPWVNRDEVKSHFNLKLLSDLPESADYDSVILAVGHREFLHLDLNNLKKNPSVVFDIKGILDRKFVDARL
ncbi:MULTISPECIES: nucleotide sugar dehydrogenase [Sphingobacterium]|uniref:UDP-glucose 6-dehydrogenase tuaD n=1 Tax=Sphingobacterium multivorum TaxID=28454 RepID=A0A2X2J3Y0_SPHMU|nr:MULTISPECIES: nucleotide sugar dehydrogenase [Sphingobacterium]QRQ61143.1 nucleotide sugar dehydrogenase [Sphingobacterium multivorum]SPZ88354.1 UDP-glucose 6-dehydrogenase tuaD [Sphingobacterium multivorum]HAE69692.1 Vi polysaccharide biosynthesis protein VipA/TviB [Sphingobacterium sp.]HAF34844.1 Vi polysaccharide biosynthesis protein VipA/TviB [Sphingobacterium sp.]